MFQTVAVHDGPTRPAVDRACALLTLVATIGSETNIGAGTITCNFDGFSKHETKIGRNVFVGSNTSLVAPVKLGEGVIVGAGSVITKDVSKDALVLERSEQIEKRGGARIYRENRKKD